MARTYNETYGQLEGRDMFSKLIDRLSSRAFAAIKWALTALSGLLTSGFIILLES